MNKLSRISLATMTCCALSLAMAQAQAQSGRLDTQLSPQPATTSGASGSTYDTAGLPTEPTGAGYAGNSRYSWIPYTTSGYIGVSVGNGSLNTRCVPGATCEDPDGAVHVYTGGMFTPYIGMQLGYFRLGDTDRNGGTTKVSGANISLVGVAPLAPNFSLVGRLGGTYGWTEVSAGVAGITVTGEEEEFVPAYGVGVSWDFHPNWSATLDWDRHHLKFAGDDQKKKTDIATIGIKYRF